MKKLALILFFALGSAQAQVIIYQQQEIVSPYQGPIMANPCGPECWAAKKYGPQYTHINQVPPEVRARVDNPPKLIIRQMVPVIVPTAPAGSTLPGQSADDVARMQQLTR